MEPRFWEKIITIQPHFKNMVLIKNKRVLAYATGSTYILYILLNVTKRTIQIFTRHWTLQGQRERSADLLLFDKKRGFLYSIRYKCKTSKIIHALNEFMYISRDKKKK